MCLGSGSSGNCYYLASEHAAILIDAGVGARTIKKVLKEHQIDIHTIKGIFVTHDHADHIKAVGSLATQYQIPVYATALVHQGMTRSYCMTKKLDQQLIHYLNKEETINFNGFQITCFDVPHDSTDNVGYSIKIGERVFLLLTDVGEITSTISSFIYQSHYLVIECNYDDTMLQNGPYPQHLKARISGPRGHMCNKMAATYLSEHYPPALQRIWLCHLSKDNNHPDLAYKTVELALKEKGIIVGQHVTMETLHRTVPSPLYELDF